ncbi:SufE family protein [Curtobacterium flaccumfaciens]|nr:SufE family protein [Curtobacterium flaccumfaciens]
MNASTDATLPATLAEIRDDFLALGQKDRLQLLLEFSERAAGAARAPAGARGRTRNVEECQSPVFITVTVGEDGDDPDVVRMHATAPREAPTTRGFASILAQGLSGLTVEQVLAVPTDYPLTIGLSEAVSPLRIRGMVGMLGRVQRQVQAAVA